MGLFEHLAELRAVLLQSAVAVLVATVAGWFFSEQAVDFLVRPAIGPVPDLKFITPAGAFLLRFKTALGLGVFVSAPIIMWRVWSFVVPGLLRKERLLLIPVLLSSILLFYGGAAFAYFVILPISLKFLVGFGTSVVQPMLTAEHYFAFAVRLTLAFGAVFQFPLVVAILTYWDILDGDFLKRYWRYGVVLVFVLSAILTPPESPETTHYSVVDADGNAVSTTYTIESGFGAKVVAPGTGFLLNNEMGDFNAWPGMTDARGYVGTEANRIAPGKRPLSSMTPTILARDGKPVALLGSPGGKTIINTVLRLIVNLVDFEMDLAAAIDAPRIHHQWMPDVVRLETGFPAASASGLQDMGHELGRGRTQGDAHCIWIYPAGARLAVADRRRSGAAAAY